MFTLDIIDTRIFHKKFSNSLLKLPKVTVTAKSENVVTKFARPFDMTIWGRVLLTRMGRGWGAKGAIGNYISYE